MKLAKVTITNFRCFESLEIPLQSQVNVFVGANGAGKTAIMDAIAIGLYKVVDACHGGGKREREWQKAGLKPNDLHIRHAPEKGDRRGWIPVVRGGSPTGLERAESVVIKCAATDFYPLPGFPDKAENGEPNPLEWAEHILYTPPNDFRYEDWSSSNLQLFGKYFDALWPEIDQKPTALITLPVVAYYRASRRLDKVPDLSDVLNFGLERWVAFRFAMDAGGYYEDMFKWFYRRENAELRERLDRRDDGRDMEYSDLRSVRRAITKSVENVERLFFRDEKVMIGLKEEIAGLQELQLDQLSDGYRNLIGLIMDFARRLAQAHPQFDDPLQAPGIMLIDEIELHLHPRWQQTVIPKLCNAFPNTQIIVTTHSPEVVTTVEAGSIQILEHAALRPCPAPTFGARSSDVVSEVMGLESLRPPNNPNTERISRLFDAIDDGNLAAAQAIREELREWAGDYPEPDLVRADLLMRRLESRKQRGSSEK